MLLNENMRAVIVCIQKQKIKSHLISPNLVADIAYELGRHLTSEQVNYISTNFK